jgi:hypothetical protein
MMNYDVLSRKPLIFKSFTGLEVPEFDALDTKTQDSHASYEEKRLHRDDRKRKIGAGHPFKLSLKDRLLMLLIYHRLYVTSTLLGFLFNLGQTNVLKNIRMLEPLVTQVLPLPGKIHQRARRLGTLDEVEALFPGFKAFLDATEQEIPRPRDKAKRKTHYSGKKKRHTVKTQITVNADGLILHKTPHAREADTTTPSSSGATRGYRVTCVWGWIWATMAYRVITLGLMRWCRLRGGALEEVNEV